MSNLPASLLIFLWGVIPSTWDDAGSWRSVLPAAGEEHEHPPLRAVAMASERPEDLKETAMYRGVQRQYAQIRFGSPASIRVAVVLDQVSPNEVDLYVDANRNRIIEERDRIDGIDGKDRTWRVPLDAAIVEGDKTRFERRSVIFRLGATGRTLSYAAAGFLAGDVTLGERVVAVRRQDGDGNGLFTDAQDRLWIDSNGDKKWDAVNEQFLFSTILPIDGTRYAVRSDEAGSRLAMNVLEGTGTVKISLGATEPKRSGSPPPTSLPASGAVESRSSPTESRELKILELAATLVGRDGAAVCVRGADTDVTVPIGDYRVSTLTLSLADAGGSQPWSFVFSDSGGRPDYKWYTVARDESITIDPIGTLEMLTGLAETVTACRAGEALSVPSTSACACNRSRSRRSSANGSPSNLTLARSSRGTSRGFPKPQVRPISDRRWIAARSPEGNRRELNGGTTDSQMTQIRETPKEQSLVLSRGAGRNEDRA